ncbi:MAG: hypothetical protein QXN59_02975 [Candidatus Micrarchaeaceae archaeon]
MAARKTVQSGGRRRRNKIVARRRLKPSQTYKVVWAGTLFGFILMLFIGWAPFLGSLMAGLAIGLLVKRKAWSVFAGFSAVIIGAIIISMWALLVGAPFAPMFLSAGAFVGIAFGFPIMYGFLIMSFIDAAIAGVAAACGAMLVSSRALGYNTEASAA